MNALFVSKAAKPNVEAYHQGLQKHIQTVLSALQAPTRPGHGTRTNSGSTNASRQVSDYSVPPSDSMTRSNSQNPSSESSILVTPPREDLPPELTARPVEVVERDEEHRRAWELEGKKVYKRIDPGFTLNLGNLDVTKQRRKSDGQEPGMSKANADAVAVRMGLAPIRSRSPATVPAPLPASDTEADTTYDSRRSARLARKRRELEARIGAWTVTVSPEEKGMDPITPTPPSPSVELRHNTLLSLGNVSPGGTINMPSSSSRSRGSSITSGSSTSRADTYAPPSTSTAPRRAISAGPTPMAFPSQPQAVTFTGCRPRSDKLYLIPPTPDQEHAPTRLRSQPARPTQQTEFDICERLRALLGPRDEEIPANGSATSLPLPGLADFAPRPTLDRDVTITNRNKRRSLGETGR